MQRNTGSFPVNDTAIFKQQMLDWANRSSICCFLDNNHYAGKHHSCEWLMAVGAATVFSPRNNILDGLQKFYKEQTDWLFGHFNYDLKNEIEDLTSTHPNKIKFPTVFLFQPETVLRLAGDEIIISCLNGAPAQVFAAIQAMQVSPQQPAGNIQIQPRISKEIYLQTIEKLRQHILRGDCYEINYCMEFFAEAAVIDPLSIYRQLTTVSPNPFSSFYKIEDKYLLCASPERYLKKEGGQIISQPIKGTMIRNSTDELADEANKKALYASSKDRSENVMVVDLMRNDLSKICKANSVEVEELFGIYTFPQLHQMISTIKGELKDGIDLTDMLKATFPVGSMTGAPKKRVMELIERYEHTKRGIFAGAVGYITPEKDLDLNVVIRSIMYDRTERYLSYQVGSGITFYSNAEAEYEECLLKAKAIEKVLR